MDKDEYKNIFDNENSFWWYRVLDDLVEYYVKASIPTKSLKILDAGCGTGRMMTVLSKYGTVFGIDASPISIEMCKSKGLTNVNIADLNNWSAENEFNFIVSLDVLYHQSFDSIDNIINSFNKALCSNGMLILNLPAFNILKRGHDNIVGGNKRFQLKEIKNILTKNGFHIYGKSYRHPILFVFILLRKLILTNKMKQKSDLAPLYPAVNQLLYLFHKIENEFIKMGFSMPFGSSLFIVAKKDGGVNNHLDNDQALNRNGFISKVKIYAESNTILNQLFRYSLVGILNTIIGLSVIYLLFNFFHFGYILSNIGGYAFGLVNSFIWNKKWTFKSSQHYSKEIIPFLIVFGISYSINLLVVVFSVELLGIHPNIAQLIGIAAYSLSNFLINKYWTFSKPNEQAL